MINNEPVKYTEKKKKNAASEALGKKLKPHPKSTAKKRKKEKKKLAREKHLAPTML